MKTDKWLYVKPIFGLQALNNSRSCLLDKLEKKDKLARVHGLRYILVKLLSDLDRIMG